MQKVIIDTDCGVDDAVAIFLAIASKKVDIVAITCVVGNTTLDNVLNNVGRVLEMAHREDIPIYAGANDNLLQIHMDRWRGHGGDGFGDVKDIPDTHLKPASNRHAALEIIDLVHKHEKQLDIITLGPLTNIAVALSLEPKLLELCGKVHMMFGSETCKGNICPLGEFNCAYDPDSAKIVFNHIKNATICSWDLTLRNLVKWDTFDKIKAFDKRGELIGKMFKIAETDFRESGFCNSKKHVGWCVPDPLCMLCYLYPEIVEEIESVQTGICTTGEGRGATMVDWFGRYNVGKTQNWVVEVDHDKVENLFLQLLAN